MISSIVIKNNPVVSRPHFMHQLQPDELGGYSHETRAMGGYWQCGFEILSEDLTLLEEYIANGLGRDVTSFDENGDIAWNGMIVELTLNLPNVAVKISLLDMANRVQVRYLTSEGGIIKRSEQYNNTASQTLFGIKERIFSGAIMATSTEADQAAEMLLNTFKYPSSPVITPKRSSGRITLDVLCHGYIKTLDWRVYNQIVNFDTEDISAQIENVITDVGQFVTSTSITENTSQVMQLQDEDKTALQTIMGATQQGDSSSNRYIVGVYGDRVLTYEQAAGATITDVDYITEALSESGDIYDRLTGIKLDKASIKPNRWIRYTDILGSLSDGTDLYTDPRATFIESVNYSDPDQISVVGNRGTLADVIMARAGFGGANLV